MDDIYQIGAVAIVFGLSIKEFFQYLKAKKNGNGSLNSDILAELKTMSTNHLHSMETAINDGNEKIVKAINDGNLKTIELLSRIEGKLTK